LDDGQQLHDRKRAIRAADVKILPLDGQNRARDLPAVVVRRSRTVKIDFEALKLNAPQLP
jgi:hypothetical protein